MSYNGITTDGTTTKNNGITTDGVGLNSKNGGITAGAILSTPTSKDVEALIKNAISLRKQMQSTLWDTTFENQFGDDMDAMLADINSVIAHCAPLLGWARAGELGDYITPE